MPPVFTAAAAAIAGYLGVTSAVGIALINFGVRVLATYVITSLITRKQDPGSNAASAQVPGRTTVNPDTKNKLPVIYGNAYMGGAIVDAKISTDQQYMWYVMAISEVTDTGNISFDDPERPGYPLGYWADKQMVFDATDKTKVTGLKNTNDPTEPIDTKIDGLMNVYFYSNGSNMPLYGAPTATVVLSDASTGGGIPADQRWDGSQIMYKTSFMIIRMKYSQDANLTGLQPTSVYVRNTLNAPGAVIYDYLTNERYGCGVPSTLIDIPSLNDLNTYSAELIPYNDNSGVFYQARYKINGPVFTSGNCLENLVQLTEACDSWLQWNETTGKWGVVINQSYEQAGLDIEDLFTIYADTLSADTNNTVPATNYAYVIGGVDITPVDLNQTYNRVEVSFPNETVKDQTDYVYLETPANLMNPNEPINKLSMQLNQVNDNVQAQYLANRKLEQARDDLVVTLTTDYSGIQVDAGDVVRVYHEMYGWTTSLGFPEGKLFRVTQVQETKDEDGNLGARLTMNEYNDQVYDNFTIDSYVPAQNTGITDPTLISTPNAPTITNSITSAAVPAFDVTVTAPTVSLGQVTSLEFWYCLASSAPTNTTNFKLYGIQYYASGPVYPKNYTETIQVTGLPASGAGFQYYWRVRAVGNRSKSSFSANSLPLTWVPSPTATVTGQNFQAIYQPSPVTVAQLSNGAPDISNVSFSLYGLSGASQVDYTTVTSNASMPTSSWRIDIPNIVYSGATFSTGPVEGSSGTYAEWQLGTLTSLTANVATVTSPIIYKDSTGNLYTTPPAVLNINKTIAGQTGSRGVVTLAYVPVTYNPTYGNSQATDANLSASFSATTGFNPPINNDGAVFFNTSTGQTSARLYNDSATPYKWTAATLQVPGSVITSNSISNTQIIANTITGDRIRGNTITGNLISAETITANNIQANAITTTKLAAGSITAGKIAAGAITAIAISADTITADKLVANTISSREIGANSIYSGAILANAITSSKIEAGAIGTRELSANSITANKIVAYSITAQQIASNTITGNNIAGNTITGTNIMGNTITGNNIAANTITGNKIQVATLTGNLLQANTITSDLIQANAITSDKIDAGAITAEKISAGAIDANSIAADSIDASKLQAFSVTAGKVAAGAITGTSIAANTITFENLVIGAVTQSKSTISDPIVEPIPFYNWSGSPKTWPDNTRCLVPSNGVTIIPTTDPRSSANTEYTEGSRIEVSFSVKFYTNNANYNIVELWKSGASTVYDRGINTLRHSYDVSTTQDKPDTLHAYGYGGLVYYSTDGGSNWTSISGSTTKTITGAITSYGNGSNVYVQVAGPLQNSDTGISTYADYKFQNFTSISAIDMVFDNYTYVNGSFYKNTYYAMEAMPATGKGGGYLSGFNYQNGRIIVGASGVILTRLTDMNTEPTNWITESSGVLKDLYSVYANDYNPSGTRSFTAITVGSTGTILKSARQWTNSGTFTWSPKATYLQNGSPLITDLYGVAGDDTYGLSSKWVAVGEYGMIQVSIDDGETWSQVPSPTPDNLNSVRYCNGTWVAVGDNGVILTATDPLGTWTQVTSTTTKNLNTIDYSYAFNTINVGGQDGIFHTSASSINFGRVVTNAPSENLALTRMTYWGSYPLVSQVSPVPPEEQRILNNQVFSATIVDTGYSAGQETTYYLVIGNMAGAQVLAGQVYLQATEVKR